VPFAVGLLHANVGCDRAPLTTRPALWPISRRRHELLGPAMCTSLAYSPTDIRRRLLRQIQGETQVRPSQGAAISHRRRRRHNLSGVSAPTWSAGSRSTSRSTKIADEETLVDRIAAGVDEARTQADRSIVARVRLTGRGPMHRTLSEGRGLARCPDSCPRATGRCDPFAWVESIRDESRPLVDLEERRLADDFLGTLSSDSRGPACLAEAGTANNAVTEGITDQAVGLPAQLDEVLDRLYANERASPLPKGLSAGR